MHTYYWFKNGIKLKGEQVISLTVKREYWFFGKQYLAEFKSGDYEDGEIQLAWEWYKAEKIILED